MTLNGTMTVVDGVAIGLLLLPILPHDYVPLRYVELGQFAKLAAKTFLVWICWSVAVFLLSLVPPEKWTNTSLDSLIDVIPAFGWFAFWIIVLSAMLRGLKLEIPKYTARQWIVVNVIVILGAAAIIASSRYISKPSSAFVMLGLWQGLTLYSKLLVVGQQNIESPQPFGGAERMTPR